MEKLEFDTVVVSGGEVLDAETLQLAIPLVYLPKDCGAKFGDLVHVTIDWLWLLPCPLPSCGGVAELIPSGMGGTYIIRCTKCLLQTPLGQRGDLAERWNRGR